jgi:hypothetical protein
MEARQREVLDIGDRAPASAIQAAGVELRGGALDSRCLVGSVKSSLLKGSSSGVLRSDEGAPHWSRALHMISGCESHIRSYAARCRSHRSTASEIRGSADGVVHRRQFALPRGSHGVSVRPASRQRTASCIKAFPSKKKKKKKKSFVRRGARDHALASPRATQEQPGVVQRIVHRAAHDRRRRRRRPFPAALQHSLWHLEGDLPTPSTPVRLCARSPFCPSRHLSARSSVCGRSPPSSDTKHRRVSTRARAACGADSVADNDGQVCRGR